MPHLDAEVLASNPKVLMGYSDTTTLLTYVNRLGVVTFHGPSVMAGFAQALSLPASFLEHVRAMLFEPRAELEYRPYGQWSEGYPDWKDPANATRTQASLPDAEGFRFIQGRGVARGELFGGCIEVLEFVKGTRFWPGPEFWSGKLLFLETSEEKPSPEQVRRWLRNYGVQGVFERISGLLFGRPAHYSREEKAALERVVLDVVAGEFGCEELPVVTNVAFGHTDPQLIMPLGVRAEVDCETLRLRLLEPAVL